MPNAVSLASALVQNTLSKRQGINSLKRAGTDRTQPRHMFSPASIPKASLTTILVGGNALHSLCLPYGKHHRDGKNQEKIQQCSALAKRAHQKQLFCFFAAVMELGQGEKCTILHTWGGGGGKEIFHCGL